MKDIIAFEPHEVNGMIVDLTQFQVDVGFSQDSGQFVKGSVAGHELLPKRNA
jgi:hypothetical protein